MPTLPMQIQKKPSPLAKFYRSLQCAVPARAGYAEIKKALSKGRNTLIHMAKHKNKPLCIAPMQDSTAAPSLLQAMNPNAFAYLWMAIEANMSVVAISQLPASKAFILALMPFIPAYEKVILVESGSRETGFQNKFMNAKSICLQSSAPKELKRLEAALHAFPDRAIMPLCANEAKLLLYFGNAGIPFIAGMQFTGSAEGFLKMLTSKQAAIGYSMHSIDIIVQLGPQSVASISECFWKAVDPLYAEKRFRVSEILNEKGFSGASMPESRAIARFAELYGLSINEALAELKRRAALLANGLVHKQGYA